MFKEDLRGTKEIEITLRSSTRSKYRDMLDQVIVYFERNPNDRAVRISKDVVADADKLAKSLREWLHKDEDLIITRRKRVVYIIKGDRI